MVVPEMLSYLLLHQEIVVQHSAVQFSTVLHCTAYTAV
jgi:hypothetical protein